jgi:hypothetical protein
MLITIALVGLAFAFLRSCAECMCFWLVALVIAIWIS